MEFRAQHGAEDIPGVAQPIHVTDLVTIESRDGNFFDRQPCKVQLNDDVRIEVEIVRIAFERNGSQGAGGIQPIAAVKFAQLCAERPILKGGQQLIADPLVLWHAFGRAPAPHPNNAALPFLDNRTAHFPGFSPRVRGVA